VTITSSSLSSDSLRLLGVDGVKRSKSLAVAIVFIFVDVPFWLLSCNINRLQFLASFCDLNRLRKDSGIVKENQGM